MVYTLPMSKRDSVPWGRSTVDTACPLDCPDTCSLAVSVECGEITKIDQSDRHDATNGFICSKVRRFSERVYGIDRLHHPGKRKPNGVKGEAQFEQVSWNQALDTIAQRMRDTRDEFGAESIVPVSYGGSNGLLSQDTADAQLFRRFKTSRLARNVCSAPTTTVADALYGRMPGVAYDDYRHARLIIVWGANPSTSGFHLIPHIRAAVKEGATLVVIDPRRTRLAKQADIHLAVRPGTDVVVALAIHRFLFKEGFADTTFLNTYTHHADELRSRADEWSIERAAAVADIDADLLERTAELYGKTSPAVIRCGWGVERNRNGGNAAMAILTLPAVAGKFGKRGGGFSLSSSRALPLVEDKWIGTDEPNTRIVNMNHLGRALTEYDSPPVKMLFVYNCNPAVTLPDQNRVLSGLKREDLFTVVFDQVMTDTARWADIILPATTFLEHYDIALSYGHGNMQLVQPVIEPVGDSRPNVDVFSDLAGRLGLKVDALLHSDIESMMHVSSALSEEVSNELLNLGITERTNPIQFGTVFPRTPDQKVDLFPRALDRQAPQGLYRFQPDPERGRYPLTLVSPATDKTINSTLGELRTRLARLQIHPCDAESRDLSSGDIVRVFNDRGEIHCAVTVNPDVKRGVLSMPKGLWRRSTMNESTVNALVPDELTDLGDGACFNDTHVEVARIVTGELGDQNMAFWTDKIRSNRVH